MFHTEYLLFSLQMTPVYIVQDHRWKVFVKLWKPK